MKAMILSAQGGIENFSLADIPVPSLKHDEVLIKTKAISINPADTIVRSNNNVSWVFGNDNPLVLGWDISGEIVDIGSSVQNFKVGDEVFGLLNHPYIGRTYAEFVAASVEHLALKPKKISHETAAVSTLAALTALQPLNKVGIKPGDRVLVTAAGGGVGHFAVQFAKQAGAYVIALASTSKKDLLLQLGADEFIDYKKEKFEEIIHDIDIVIDGVRDDQHLLRSLNIIRPGGTLISLWTNVTEALSEEFQLKGINIFYNMVLPNGVDMQYVADLLDNDLLKPHISKIFPFEEIPNAHIEIEKGHTTGKLAVSF